MPNFFSNNSLDSIRQKIQVCRAWLVDAVFPISCAVCGLEGDWLCADHRSALAIRSHHECPVCRRHQVTPSACQWCSSRSYLDQLWVVADYDQVIKSLVHTLKYQLAYQSVAVVTDVFGSFDRVDWDDQAVLMPLPLHARRERERGFNQAQLIATAISEITGNQVVSSPVRRIIYRTHQAGLSAQQRRANIGEDFIFDPDKININPDQRIIIVDDVYTTGATMQAVGKVLKLNGFSKVSGVVLARGE